MSHFNTGTNQQPGDTGDPFLLLATPVARFAHGFDVRTDDDGTSFPDNFVNLVVPAAAVVRVTLDGERIDAAGFTAIGASSA